jgi:hypothetical protein
VRSSKPKYRSKLEGVVARQLSGSTGFQYEGKKLAYEVQETRHYIPDFILQNGIHIEVKGYLRATDRKKLILVKKQHPDIDLRLIFQRASNKIHKKSKTTYADWARKHGFIHADNGRVPREWLLK